MKKWLKFIIISTFITLLSITSAIVIKNMSFNNTGKLDSNLFASINNHDELIKEIESKVDNQKLFLINSIFFIDINDDSSIENISISCETEDSKRVDLTKNGENIDMAISTMDTKNYELLTLNQYLDCCSSLYLKYESNIKIRSDFQLANFVVATEDNPIWLYENGTFVKINYKINGKFAKFDIFLQDESVEYVYIKY